VSAPSTLLTPRITLRGWRSEDLAPFAALNADPEVMRYFPATLTRAESDAFAERIEEHLARHGFGLWAVELFGEVPFAGYVGLAIPAFQAAFTPCVEIGWRLARAFWGRGYATEAARAVVTFAFATLRLPELVSFTVPENLASRRVMEKVGMTRDPADDFEHPGLPAGHRLRRHVLYRLRA
jgi:ribosomal-protein-alanine N-acetyltransferase